MNRVKRTALDWQALVREWESGTLSARRFCEQQGIGYASFCQWRKRLRAEAEVAIAPASFIDLSTLSGSVSAAGQRWQIVLSLGNGVELRLSQR